jgi:ubiquinone/menaquinone biosynthesis C-methylase UbiE
VPEDRSLEPEIAAYYEQGLEPERLATGAGRLELVRTQELLARHLPDPPATVLDVGGAAGVHAIPLAEQGYEVRLVDPMPSLVEQARADAERRGVRLADATVGDARLLPAADASADAVLLLGPLYHLTERAERLAALREARRVLRPGGVVAAAAISRFASTWDGLIKGFLVDPAFEAIVERTLGDGQHRNPTGDPRWFTTAYFHLPEELREEVAEAGFETEGPIAVEGPGQFLTDLDDWLDDPTRRGALLRAVERIESDPSVAGATGHMLVFGRPRQP